MFTAPLFTPARAWQQHGCPSIDEWTKDARVCVCVHARGYYSAIKRRQSCHLWQHGWTWRALCDKWSKTERQIPSDLTRVESWGEKTKPKLIDTDWWLPKAGVGEIGENCLTVQTSSYKISYGDAMYSMVTIVSTTLLYIWKLLRDLKSFHYKKNIVTVVIAIN